MKFKDAFPDLAFKDEYDDNLGIIDMGLTSLEGCPKIIHGNFNCSINSLTSLIGGPERVDGYYSCSSNNFETLDGIASYIGDGGLFLASESIKTIAGIHKKINYYNGILIVVPRNCKSGMLDILKMNAPNLNNIHCGTGDHPVSIILTKYLRIIHEMKMPKSQAILHCQYELFDNDLDEYTQ